MYENAGLMDVKKTADYLAVPTSRIYSLVFKKELPHYKLGRSVRFKREDIDKFVQNAEEKITA